MTVLDRLRADLGNHRAELVAEEKRITGELEEVRQAIAGIDQVLGGRKVQGDTGRTPAGNAEERELLCAMMLTHLKIAGGKGLTSSDLFTLIQPEWTGSAELSVRRIGSNAAAMTEITGDGQRWYYVPAETAEGERDQ